MRTGEPELISDWRLDHSPIRRRLQAGDDVSRDGGALAA